ncbi:DnaJ C-terminal domain-containing protein [Micrococcoides hystricis]|uniref:DnaJ C-terminal domain-containing protein n=1 Tax=Micrococcoides hystricis TaxID=1572761 RepID=A0ABV6PF46_9MICC
MASQDWLEKDFYQVLGVSKDATDADIKKAYRKLARKYHPDTNAGDAAAEKKFKDITEANSVLSDPEQRKEYDAIRAMGSGARFTAGGAGASNAGFEDLFGDMFGGGGGRNYSYSTQGGPDLSDLFGQFGGGGGFGGSPFGGGYGQPTKGADRTAATTISFGGSIKGTTVKFRVPQSGETIDVRIPAGIRDGQKVRVAGKGEPGQAGPGDLLVTVNVREHKLFKRDGDNIRITVPVSFDEAALGAQIQVPTLDGGTVTMKVPAGSNSGRTLRLKGRGVSTKKRTGDLLVSLEIKVPQNLNDAAKAAVEAFKEATENENPRASLMADARL